MADIKLTPPAVNLTLYTGDTSTLVFRFPIGSLAARTFTSSITPTDTTVDPIDGEVTIDGDVITVVFAGDDVATLDGLTGRFHLTETTSGRAEVLIGGIVRTSRTATTPTTGTVTVTQAAATVDVAIAGLPATVNGVSGPTIVLTAADVGAPTVGALTAEATTRADADTADLATATGRAIAFAIIYGG